MSKKSSQRVRMGARRTLSVVLSLAMALQMFTVNGAVALPIETDDQVVAAQVDDTQATDDAPGETNADALEDATDENDAEGADAVTTPDDDASDDAANDAVAPEGDDAANEAASNDAVANADSSSDLADFLTSISLTDGNGNEVTTVKEKSDYNLKLTFAENSSKQFSDGTMTYQLPDGVTISPTGGSITITGTDSDGSYTVQGNTYSVDENGKITFTWNTEDPNWERLQGAANCTFELDFSAKFEKDATFTNTDGTATKTVTVDSTGEVKAAKSASYDSSTNKVTYTITLTSDGLNQNVVATDKLTGDLMTLDADSITVTSSKGTVSGTYEVSDNGFTYKQDSMTNGEVVTITYTATPDTSKMTNAEQSLTFDETGNTVKVTSDKKPGGNEASSYVNKISYSGLTKSASNVGDVSNGKQTVSWTITANAECNASMAGKTITDSIDSASQSIMKYKGDATVKVYDKSGSLIDTRTFATGDGTSWTYNVPSTDTGNYKYVITYDTEVDVSGLYTESTVKNKSTDTDNPTGTTGEAKVGPGEGQQMGIAKEATEVTYDSITWTSTITVPANGLPAGTTFTDDLPNLSQGWLWDTLQGDVTVTFSYADGTSYSIDTSDPHKVTITFPDGIKGNGSSDTTVTVKLTTKNNSEWLSYAEQNSWAQGHTNNATLTVGTQHVTASATGIPIKTSFQKTGNYSTTVTRDGKNVPMYYFNLTLSGVSDASFDEDGYLVIDDEFDTSYLEYSTEVYGTPGDQGYVYGGNQYYQGENGTQAVDFESTSTGGKIKIRKDSIPKTSGGEYYSYYKVVYYLNVKPSAMDTLDATAAGETGGTHTFTNNASSKLGSDSANVTYTTTTLTKAKTNVEVLDDGSHLLTFTIVANPDARKVGDEDTLTLTDTITGLNVDYTTIKATPSDGVTWSSSGSTLTFKIPNSTKVTITYQARTTGTGTISYNNVAQLNGQSKTVTGTETVTTSGSGTASNPSIRILKTASGDMSTKLAGATFALLDSNGNAITDKNGKAVTVTTGSDGTATVSGDQNKKGWVLETGTTYYLKETVAPEGYTLDDTAIAFTISKTAEADYANSIYLDGDLISVTNDKTSNTGKLTVTKTFAGSAASDVTDSAKSHVAFVVSGPNNYSATISYDDMTNGSYTFTGLEAGEYTITEYNSDGTAVYTTTYKVTEGEDAGTETGGTKAAADVENDQTTTVDFTNYAQKTTAKLQATKAVSGSDYDGDEEFTFVLAAGKDTTLPSGYTTTQKVKDGETATWGELTFTKEGTYTYTITETAPTTKTPGMTYSSQTITATVKVTASGTDGALTATVTYSGGDGTNKNTITNNYTTGKLKLNKVLRTYANDNANEDFEFTVHLESASGTDLTGTYSGTKTSADGKTTTSQDVTFDAEGNATIKLKPGENFEFDALPDGYKYTITEKSKNNYVVWSKTGDTGTISASSEAECTYTNQDARSGDLKVQKKLTGNDQDASTEFTLRVTLYSDEGLTTQAYGVNGTFGDMTFTRGVATVTLKGGETLTASKIPIGLYYKVEEKSGSAWVTTGTVLASGDEYELTQTTTSKASDADDKSYSGPITTDTSGDKAVLVTLTNNHDTFGGIKLTKTLKGDGADTSKEFTFTVTLTDTSISGTYGGMTFSNGVATVTLKGGDTVSALGLPNGVGYTITETDYSDEGYVTTSTNSKGTVVGVAEEAGDVTETMIDPNDDSTFTNTRNGEGTLSVTKIVEGNQVDANAEFEISVKVEAADLADGVYGDMTFKDGVATFKLKNGQTATATGLPNGLEYSIEETSANKDGYTTTYKLNGTAVSGTAVTDSISDAKTDNVVITNAKYSYGGLVLKKATAGNDADKKTWFAYKVTLSDKTLTGWYGDVYFENGVSVSDAQDSTYVTSNGLASSAFGEDGTAKFYAGYVLVTKDAPRVITGLPTGVTYTVEEEDYSGTYDSQKGTNTSGTIKEISNDASEVTQAAIEKDAKENVTTFTNTRNRWGKLKIAKKIQGNKPSTTQTYTFKVTMADASGKALSGIYGGVTFTNGVATVTIDAGDSLLIEGLPLGATFTVDEVTEGLPVGSQDPAYVLTYKETVTNADGKSVDEDRTETTNSGDITTKQHTVTVTNTISKITAAPQVTKHVDGPDAEEETFTFDLAAVSATVAGTDADGNAIEVAMDAADMPLPESTSASCEASSDEDGTATFGDITFTQPGTYLYKITERAGTTEHMTYDTEPRYVTVTVTSNDKGKLSAKVRYGTHSTQDEASQNKSSSLTVTNTYTAVTETSVAKVWEDNDNEYGRRGDSITVTLTPYVDGTAMSGYAGTYKIYEDKVVTTIDGEEVTLSTKNWTLDETVDERLGKLYKYYKDADGTYHELSYVWTEDESTLPAGYTYTGETHDKDGLTTLYNNFEVTTVTGTKTWVEHDEKDHDNASEVTLVLVRTDADGVEEVIDYTLVTSSDQETTGATLTWDGDDYTFANLPKYDEKGDRYTYTVYEEEMDGYRTSYGDEDGNDGDHNDITNTEVTEVSGTKIWDDANDADGIRPASITVRLLANGKEVDSIEVTADDGWTYSFIYLPIYDENDVKITYTVVEDEVENYSTTYDGYDIINSYTPNKTAVAGSKVWVDDDDADGSRPSSITVRLLANGKEVASKVVTAGSDGTWSYEFTDLLANEGGKKITYTVTEDAVDGYTTTINGYTIVNTHMPKTPDTDTPTTPANLPKMGDPYRLITPIMSFGVTLLAVGALLAWRTRRRTRRSRR